MKSAKFIVVILLSSCAYFNTFYNTQKYYREGKKLVTNDTLRVDSENFNKAIEKATIVIVKHPTSRWVDDALFIMGASYYYKGDYLRALDKLDFLCLNYPKSHFYDDALYYKGLAYYKEHKLGHAIINLKEAMESKAYQNRALIGLCYVYQKNGNYALLIETAQNLLNQHLDRKDRRVLLQLLGEAQFHQQEYAAALATFDNLLTLTHLEQDKHDLKFKIAQIYLEMGQYELCRDFLTGEDDPEFKNLLADLNVRNGTYETAKELYLDVAHTGFPDFATQAYCKLAELYENEDSLPLAIAYYDSAITISGTGIYGNKAKKKTQVLRQITTLLNDTTNLDRAKFMLAEIYFVDINDTARALQTYQEVYEEFPQSEWAPKAYYAQFWINKNLLHNDRLAQRLSQELLTKYPNTEYALDVKRILEMKPNQ